MIMTNDLLARTVEALVLLREISETDASAEPDKPGAWTNKEEPGHLIDSAANNHARLVRAALDGHFAGPRYAQEEWVRLHGYRDLRWFFLVDMWRDYNRLLAHVVKRIPGDRLGAQCTISSGAPVTPEFLIDDYVLHMRHHLDHILSRDYVTPYPRLS